MGKGNKPGDPDGRARLRLAVVGSLQARRRRRAGFGENSRGLRTRSGSVPTAQQPHCACARRTRRPLQPEGQEAPSFRAGNSHFKPGKARSVEFCRPSGTA